MKSSGISHELLSPDEAQQRFPQFRFADNFLILFQPDSGFVAASKAVMGHLKLAQSNGAEVNDNTAVEEIRILPNSVEVKTGSESYTAGKLIVTAGAWAKTLLQQTGIDFAARSLTLSVELSCACGFRDAWGGEMPGLDCPRQQQVS